MSMGRLLECFYCRTNYEHIILLNIYRLLNGYLLHTSFYSLDTVCSTQNLVEIEQKSWTMGSMIFDRMRS